GDTDSFRNTGKMFKMREIDRTLIAGDSDRGSVRARHNVRTEAKRFDHANDVVDLALTGAGVHYDEHGVKRRLLTGNYTLRSNLTHLFRFRSERNRRQRPLDLGPMFLVLRRQLQIFAKVLNRFVGGKSRSFRGNFKQNSTGLAKINGMKIKTVDHRRNVETELDQPFSPAQLFLVVCA